MKKHLKIAVRVLTITLTVLLGLIILFNLSTTIKRRITGNPCETVLGFGTAVVISGSMEPEISIDDMVVIFKTGNYEKGDVVTYLGNTRAVTHRIIDTRTDENGMTYYTTKGDYNNTDDGEITADKIVGEVLFIIPKFGRVQSFISQPIGFLTITLIAGAVILVPELLTKKDKEEKHDENNEKN